MRETLYTIPVWDGFGSGEGCPLCRIYQILEKQALSGILGPAMMEPSIREETNRLGFCPRHMGMLARQEGKLPFALLLQTRVGELRRELRSQRIGGPRLDRLLGGCYLCQQLERSMAAMAENVALCWAEDPRFREVFAQLDSLCPEHGWLLLTAGKGRRSREFHQRPPRHWTARWPNWRGRSGRSAPPLITGMQEKMH